MKLDVKKKTKSVGYEVLIAVPMKSTIFCASSARRSSAQAQRAACFLIALLFALENGGDKFVQVSEFIPNYTAL
jgi:hypothetical protein